MNSLRQLRAVLALFFVALAVPTAALIWQAYQRLQWESFHQHQSLAEEFAVRVDERLRELLQSEDARAFTEYAFFNVVTPTARGVLQRSPLAIYPPPPAIAGLIGHFQIDEQGVFSAPFVPPAGAPETQVGISADEVKVREQLATRMQTILAANRLLAEDRRDKQQLPALLAKDQAESAAADVEQTSAKASDEVALEDSVAPAQSSFDALNEAPAAGGVASPAFNALGRVADLKLEQRFQGAPVMAEAQKKDAGLAQAKTKRALRKERGALPDLASAPPTAALQAEMDSQPRAAPLRIHAFESEVDALQASLLASGELVLFRKVWRGGQRYVQGLLVDRERFLAALVITPFATSPLARTSSLLVARHGEVVARHAGAGARSYDSAPTLRGTLLYQSRLSAPFSDFELIFSVTQLPAGAGTTVIGWLAAVLALVLCGGSVLMYRLGARQLAVARQQQDFIAAVSHELKTPLTSIRMYGEMLREGWAPQAKHQDYYRFIHDEAERLTRLINNVLDLARMTRNELRVELCKVSVAQLLDLLRSKLGSVIAHAGRGYEISCTEELAACAVLVDVDCFTQIFLNLTDNALKFTSGEQALMLNVRAAGEQHIEFALRDFGPGVAQDQLPRIFGLFYRGENALTRATAGTGIGLALVKRLVELMHGRVSVVNCEPGAEFRVMLARAQP